MIDTTSPPDEITKRAEELIKYVKVKNKQKLSPKNPLVVLICGILLDNSCTMHLILYF